MNNLEIYLCTLPELSLSIRFNTSSTAFCKKLNSRLRQFAKDGNLSEKILMTASPAALTVTAALDGLSIFLIANHTPHRQSHDAKQNHTNNCCSHNRLLSDKQTHRLTDVLEKSFVPVGKCARA